MYRILIVEDELPAAKRLEQMLSSTGIHYEVITVTDSIENTVAFLNTKPKLDLIFMDIQLADGLCFNIFSKIEIDQPIIFTTAYNQFALRAFKVNSIDYLLKPIGKDELNGALAQLDKLTKQHITPKLLHSIEEMLEGPSFKERFLIKSGKGLSFLKTVDIQYLYADSGLTFARTIANKRHNLEETLDQLESNLNPTRFHRINRKMLVNIESIRDIRPYFNSRLVLTVDPKFEEDVIVSRQRVANFKLWLDS